MNPMKHGGFYSETMIVGHCLRDLRLKFIARFCWRFPRSVYFELIAFSTAFQTARCLFLTEVRTFYSFYSVNVLPDA